MIVGENHSRDIGNLKRVLKALRLSPPRCADVIERHTNPAFADSRIGSALEAEMAAKRSSDRCVPDNTGAESRHSAISSLCPASFEIAIVREPRRQARHRPE